MLSKGKGMSTSGIKSLISAMATNQAQQRIVCYPKTVRETLSKEMTFELRQMDESITGRKNKKCNGLMLSPSNSVQRTV